VRDLGLANMNSVVAIPTMIMARHLFRRHAAPKLGLGPIAQSFGCWSPTLKTKSLTEKPSQRSHQIYPPIDVAH
jgi:hypothetical protein